MTSSNSESPGGAGDWSAPPERVKSDFGGLLRGNPDYFVVARNEADVSRSLARALREDVSTTFRGAGHSCGGQTLPAGGLLLESFTESPEIQLLDSRRARLPGRGRLWEIETALNARGLAVPVLPDYLWLSLGGVLSVGGIGVSSPGYGFLADQVESLRLILPAGGALECSRVEKADVFARALGGRGAAGYIESAVVRVKPAEDEHEIHRLEMESMSALADFMANAAALTPAPRSLNAWITNRDLIVETSPLHAKGGPDAFASGIARREKIDRENEAFALHERRAAWLDQYPDHLRLWSDYFFNEQSFRIFLKHMEELRRERPEAAPAVMYVLLIRRPADAPHCPGLPAGPGPHFSVGLYFMTPRHNPLALAAAGTVSRELRELARGLGGFPYGYGWEPA